MICIPCVEPEIVFLLFQPEFWLAAIAVVVASPVVAVLLGGKLINWSFWRVWALHQRRDIEEFLALAGAPGLPERRWRRVIRWGFPWLYRRYLMPAPQVKLEAKLNLPQYEQAMMLLTRRDI